MKTCYCHIPPDLLVKIVREKFIEKTPTLTLLQRYSGDQETEYVSTIVLLDVPESEVREMLKNQPEFLAHFLDCRTHAREVLEGKLPDLKKHLQVSL